MGKERIEKEWKNCQERNGKRKELERKGKIKREN